MLRGIAEAWLDDADHWTAARFAAMSGDSVINVRASLPEDTRDCCSFFVPLRTYLDYMMTGNQTPLDEQVVLLAAADGRDVSEFRYYSGDIGLDLLDPACAGPVDLSVLPHFGPGERCPDPIVQFWLGRKGSSIGLHRDGFFGYLVHLRGRKEVTLLAPDQRRFLSLEHWGGIYSPVDVYDVDLLGAPALPPRRPGNDWSWSPATRCSSRSGGSTTCGPSTTMPPRSTSGSMPTTSSPEAGGERAGELAERARVELTEGFDEPRHRRGEAAVVVESVHQTDIVGDELAPIARAGIPPSSPTPR